MKPPIQGWSVTLRIKGASQFFQGTPQIIVDRVYASYKRNGIAMTKARIWDFLNKVWQSRDPGRAVNPKGAFIVPKEEIDPEAHIYVTIESYGALFWGALSIYGMMGVFDKEGWLSAIKVATAMIDPAKTPALGSASIYEEWAKIRLDSDPEKVDNEHEAAHWVWLASNQINKKLNKPEITFAHAVAKNNWSFRVEGDQVTPV